MTEEKLRDVGITRLRPGQYEATNPRGGKLVFGRGEDDDAFTPVELLLTAIAGCSAIDVDLITSKRAEPTRFEIRMEGQKIRDEHGNRLTDLVLSFDVEFADDDGGHAAAAVLPRAVQQSHDRLCTVSRTVEVGTPVAVRVD
ncbi:MAG: OsmC family protein [Nocardioidaceae bacterium]